ncbi:hypothetical protein D3C81_355000 [compost metagenome]
MAAMAWAPPMANTFSTPQARAANSISSLAGDGVQSTTSRQPAMPAGMASIITVEGSGALPPGT